MTVWRSITDRSGRQRVRAGIRGEEIGLLAVAVALMLAAITGLAGQCAALIAGQGWPSWPGITVRPLIGVYAHPGDPMRGWPGASEASSPPAVVYWPVFALLLAGLVVAFWLSLRALANWHTQPGFATRHDVASRLGTRALLKQSTRLRPQLARTTPRPRPEQLGTRLGRDVHTGVDCWSSVRQSKFVVGPSESGKTSAVVIPEALDHDGSLLAPSSRADVMAATWRHRAERGRVLLFDPLRTAPGLPLLRWDLVQACADPATAMRRAQDLMTSVDMTGVSNGDAWRNRGQAILRNLLHAAALSHKDIRTVLKWAYDQTSVEPASILDRSSITPDNWAEMQYSVIQTPERQRAGYYMAVEGALEPFMHPAVMDTCLPGRDGFDPTTFVDSACGQQTIYLLAQVDQAVAVTDLLGALMNEVIDLARAQGQRSENNRLDPPLKFLVDEAPNTATLKQLPSLISDGGGRGIPTTMVVQDRSQAVSRWGREDAASMWGAATVRMVLPGVAGDDEMREIANYFVEFDEEIPTWSRGGQTGFSEQFSLRSRASMTPAEVRSIAPFHALIIAAGGLRPVETELTPYFRRPDAAATAAAEREFYAALNEGRTAL